MVFFVIEMSCNLMPLMKKKVKSDDVLFTISYITHCAMAEEKEVRRLHKSNWMIGMKTTE